ncbi:alpha-1,2-fucosyltransferase [Anaerostipes caccae]|uniref:alpha-1,2-fucosyltransferase n=1 Tax=Anaerostipes caccae TaxID=105841 RepID=UPI00101BE944|nr:alpha-1,2-fucosyltransferase [Anaerostipes caccae]
MIYLKITGRCGNQLFQYAFARLLQYKTGQDIYIDFSLIDAVNRKKPELNFQDELCFFQTCNYYSNHTDVFNKKKVKYIIYKIFEKCLPKSEKIRYLIENIFSPFLTKLGIIYFEFGYKDIKIRNCDFYLKGYFESPKYFQEIDEILIREFTPKIAPSKINRSLYHVIKSTQSICVTVRKFELQSAETKELEICNKEYFYRGVEIIRETYPDANVIIFSDDIQWCKDNLNFTGNVFFESGNDPVYEKLRLMYSCKHFVISNSTFSWWAQHLSRNPNKIVIAPSIWRYNSKTPVDLYEKSWRCIDLPKE